MARRPELDEETGIPIIGPPWLRRKGATMYLAVLAYPATKDWKKRDKFMKAVRAWMLKAQPRRWVKSEDKLRPRDIRATMNRAFWRIDSRRLRAGEIALGLIGNATGQRNPGLLAMRRLLGGRLDGFFPRSVRQALGAVSAADTDRIANAMHHVWAESLPVLHLAMALPSGQIGRKLIIDPSWVAKSLHDAEFWRSFTHVFAIRHGCAAVQLLPSS
jgi:hypothetical protein